MDLSTIAISYEYGEGATAEQQEILRNVRTILSTPIGTCPLYRDFGRAWKKVPPGWSLSLLSSHTEFERTFGKPASKKRKLYNGMLKCDLFMYQ